MSTDLLRTAYHEAGHAVADVALGIPFNYVAADGDGWAEVVWTGDFAAREAEHLFAVDRGEPLTPAVKRMLRNVIVARLAGGVAERRFRKRRFHHYGDAGDSTDLLGAMPAVRALMGSPTDIRLFRTWQRAEGGPIGHLDLDLWEGELLTRLRHRTARLLHENWPAVVRVAEALHREHFLRADDVRYLALTDRKETAA